MDNQLAIRIECEGSITVSLDELKELQSYKDLTDKAYDKARLSIVTLGFSFPIFFWEDKDGTKYIIDAHQRKRVLMRMRSEEGYIIPPLPAVRIFAKDKTEAKKKILAQESQYGKIQQEGLYEFINESGFELDSAEIESYTDIPILTFEETASAIGDEEEPQKDECDICKAYHFNNHEPQATS